MTERRVEVVPRWPFRLPRFGGRDGLLRARDGVLRRLVHVEGRPVVVRVAQTATDRVLFGAQAETAWAAEQGIERLRFALGVDLDLRPFHQRFRADPLLGRALRANPYLRPGRHPDPFEALAWAVCEQKIEYERAVRIERRLIARLGRSCPRTALRDAPDARRVAACAPTELQALDLGAGRARALVRAAGEVAAGRVALHDPDGAEHGWRRLRAIPGIGAWTVEMLAGAGQGRLDQVAAGDLNLRKAAGPVLTGDPRARAEEHEVRALLAPYAPWAGLAGAYLIRLSARARPAAVRPPGPSIRAR